MSALEQALSESKTLSCMEIWGGNQPADIGVKTFGLDAWLFSQPHEGHEAGGDVHYLSSCASGNITRALLADVSGHGVGASNVAIQLRELMRQNINRVSHRRLVAEINDEFTSLTDVGCFATALVFSYFAPTRKLAISNAGHPPPFVFHAKKKEWMILQDATSSSETRTFADMPFGVEASTQYSDQIITMGPGDMLFCYSDALIEMELHDGTQLGTNGLFEAIKELDINHPESLIERFLRRLENNASLDIENASDDLTALVLRAHATKASSRFGRMIAAPVRLLLSKLGMHHS